MNRLGVHTEKALKIQENTKCNTKKIYWALIQQLLKLIFNITNVNFESIKEKGV